MGSSRRDANGPPPGSPADPVDAGTKRDSESISQDSPGSPPADGGFRKKKTKKIAVAAGPSGNRGVASLTPEQLAKKRANDREAQRAIRERTRNQIETLERRVEELTNLNHYRELQVAVRAKEAAERENADIKRQLAAVVAILKPMIGTVTCEEHTSLTQSCTTQAAPQSSTPGAQCDTPATTTSSASSARDAEQHSLDPQAWPRQEHTAGAADHNIVQLHLQRQRLRRGLHVGSERLGLSFLLRPGQRVHKIQGGPHGAHDTPQYYEVPLQPESAAVINSQATRARPGTRSPSPRVDGLEADAPSGHARCGAGTEVGPTRNPRATADVGGSPEHKPRHAIAVKNCYPTCLLDSVLLDFLRERRQRAADGLPMQEVVGPRYPSVSSLLSPANSVYSHPLSKVFTDIIATFPDISALPSRVAVLYIMFLFMRWQISPTRENYERLPAWMRPCPAQLEHPHAAWIDHVPFPLMRERLVRAHSPDEYAFDNFFIPFTKTLWVSWPYEETDTVLLVPGSDEIVINPVFERHVRILDNWTLGDVFVRAYPSLAGTCKVTSGS